VKNVWKVAVLVSMFVPGAVLAGPPKLELKPCTSPSDAPPEARCGTYEVWENRAAKSGRKIPLRVLVLPALGPDRLSDPFVFFNGGPGDSNVDSASWLAADYADLRQQRDILLVDFRGTGGSGGLFCPEMESSDGLQGFLDHFLAPDAVRACAERLSKTADLSQYTNDTSVDDVDEVRAALGYDKLNIFGGSGGTRSALIYARRHPDRVRTLTLGGLVPPEERGPFPMARHAQRALDGLIAECQADEGCRAAFPRLREELAAVLRRAEQDPVTVTLKDQEPEASGEPVEVRMTRGAVVQSLRYMLYVPRDAARLPLDVHLAAQGDWTRMAEFARSSNSGMSSFARGYYLSLTCAEDLPFIREDEIPAAIQGTFLGDFRIRTQREACAAWPVRPVGREFLDPVTSDAPTLLISGERDPVTPPLNAERAARTLKNSVHVVMPDGGHGFDGIEGAACVNDMVVRFVKAGTVKGLDTSCVTGTKRPAFLLEPPKLELKPCTSPAGLPPEARCGTYEVWENRAAKSGRKIPLRVVVIPALGPDRLSDPFVYFAGGPGASSVASASWIAEAYAPLRKRRDILLVDFRGTGESGGLFCTELKSSGLQGFLDHFLPPEQVKACAERLSKTADLSQYTNDTSADDIDEVRAALGYDKVNLFGGSGGTRTALVYARRHPDRVRTLTLLGPVTMDERGPFSMARNAQRALDGLIAECEGDAGCRAAFPRLRDELAAVLRQAEQKPVAVTLADEESGKPIEVRMTRGAVAQTLRYLLYSPSGAARLPLQVHQAAQGDWIPLAESARDASVGLMYMAQGYYLSLTCAEDLPFIREDEIPAAIQGTFLGDFRIRTQREACAAWPVRPVGREFLDPVTSDVPTLLLAGERDPVTPPFNGERVARTLKNSFQVVMPDGSHGFSGIEGARCVDDLLIQLVETGTVKGLDTSCGTRTKRPAFQLEPPKEGVNPLG
jgi:pimeloyl-ACP methyl ester carboxylesterase